MFTLEQLGPNLYHVVLDTEEVRIAVGEISRGRGWQFHYRVTASSLKPAAYAQLTVFGKEQAELREITARLLK